MLVPDLPGSVPLGVEVVEMLLVLEGVHASPEAIVLISDELLFGDEAPEWLVDEFFAFLQVLENIFFENEVAAINAHGALGNIFDIGNQVAAVEGNEVVTEIGADAEEAGNFLVLAEVLDLLG